MDESSTKDVNSAIGYAAISMVKNDLAVFTFKGVCRGRISGTAETKFPVTESIDAYSDRKIEFNNITVNVNAPVSASFDSQSQAYSFDLRTFFRSARKATAAFTAWKRRASRINMRRKSRTIGIANPFGQIR